MRVTKHAHACLEVEHGDARIVVDPGGFTPRTPALLETADAVLVTHAHGDHLSLDAMTTAMRVRESLVVYGPDDAMAPLRDAFADRARTLAPGDVLEVAGLDVSVHGGLHAEILTGVARDQNLGFLLGGAIYHPGDSFDVPQLPVEVLLVPVSGPWMKIAEAAAFVKQVAPRRAVAIHDALLSRVGLELVGRLLGPGGPAGVEVDQITAGDVVWESA